MMKKTILLFLMAALLITTGAFAQSVGINSDGTTPAASAMLDVSSTAKGFLAPRMTAAQKALIALPATGLLVYQTDGTTGYYYNSGTAASPSWTQVGAASGSQQWTTTGSNIYYNTGNVGIGTTSPQAKLQVDGTVFINNAAAPGFYGQSAGVNKVYLGYDGAATGLQLYNFQSTQSLNIQDDGDLVYGGNVGIGTTTPVSALQLGSLTSISTVVNKQSLFGNNMYYTGGQTGTGVWKYITTAPASAMRLWADGSIRFHTVASGTAEATINSADMDVNGVKMIIQNDGNVGIGTTTPTTKLDVNGSITSTAVNIQRTSAAPSVGNAPCILFSNTGGGYYDLIQGGSDAGMQFFSYVGGGWTERMRIASSGNVGIGTTTPSRTLYVNGTSGGTNAWENLSDKRLKKDVLSIENGLDKVMALRPITFNWNKTVNPELKLDDRNHLGFIAQEVETVLPQVVSTTDDAMKTKSVAYSDIVPVLTKAIQEQQATIEAQQKQIDELKTQNTALAGELKAEIENLKKAITGSSVVVRGEQGEGGWKSEVGSRE